MMRFSQWKGLTRLVGAAASGSAAGLIGHHASTQESKRSPKKNTPKVAGGQLPANHGGSHSFASFIPKFGFKDKSRYKVSVDTAARCISAKEPRTGKNGKKGSVPVDCGEDAFFMAMPTDSSCCFLGVADGVGGWADLGIDPALFAWDLMKTCEEAAKENKPQDQSDTVGDGDKCIEPKSLLVQAFDWKLNSGTMSCGSSTAIVASLDCSNAKLEVANLGDSGLVVVRDQKMALQTREQHHSFNCPYQLVCNPPGQGPCGDKPETADKYSVEVKDGDLVLLGSDGFFDNVPKSDIVRLTSTMKERNAEAKDMAEALVKYAHMKSQEETGLSPFAWAAQNAGYDYEGGKTDDITLVIAKIGE